MSMVQVVLSTRREGDRCKGCYAAIVWFRTKQGKPMPFNADVQAHVQDGLLGPPQWALIDAKYAHHATCPKVDQFRRPK